MIAGNGMSDRELPEVQSGTIPLFVSIFIGVALVGFAGLIYAVLNRDLGQRAEQQDPTAGIKHQHDLLSSEDKFRVRIETTAGPLVMEVRPDWAPRGATQFRDLVKAEFFRDCRFFRVVPDFVVQFGINGDPVIQADWTERLLDEEVTQTNRKWTVTYAKTGEPNSRTTQLFINLKDNAFLDKDGFSPIGEIVEGRENVEKIYAEYEDNPNQGRIQQEGNGYLSREFPKLDYITSVKILDESPPKKDQE